MMEFKSRGFFNRGKALIGVALMLLAAMLVACGDSPTSTSAPVATTTASAATTSAAGANGATPGTGGQGRGNFSPPVSGTVQSFDATAKTLTIKEASGTNQTYDTSTTRIVKSATITKDDLAKLVSGNVIVQVVGDKGSDGSYNATRIVLADPATMAGPGGQFGGGQGGQGRQGQLGTPGAGGQGQPPANGTSGAGGQPGFGGGRGGIIVSNPVVSGTTITGTDFSGVAVTVNLTSTTVLTKRDAGALTDLKTGETVSVTARPAQSGTTEAAITITIGE